MYVWHYHCELLLCYSAEEQNIDLSREENILMIRIFQWIKIAYVKNRSRIGQIERFSSELLNSRTENLLIRNEQRIDAVAEAYLE